MGTISSDSFSYPTDGVDPVTPEKVIAAVAKRFGYGEPLISVAKPETGDRPWSWTAPDKSLNLRLIAWKAGHPLTLQLNRPYVSTRGAGRDAAAPAGEAKETTGARPEF